MMKKNSVGRNYIYNLIYQIFVMIMPLITTPYISRVIGATGVGVYSYTISITAYFVMLGTLGITIYGQREIAYVQDDKSKRSKLFFELLTIRVIATIISTVSFYLFFCNFNEYSLYFKILIFEIIASAFDISWFYQGMEDFKKVVIRNILVKIILMISIFIFVKNQNDVWIYILIYTLSVFIGNITLWINLKNHICFSRDLQLKKHIIPMILLFIPQVAVQIYTVLDKTMLGYILSDISIVGYYEQAQKIVKLSLAIITTLGVVMIPRIANIFSKGDKKELINNLNKSFNFVWFLGLPIIFGLLSISHEFVPIFYGPGFDEVEKLINVFAPIVLIIGFANVIGVQYLIPTKKQNIYTFSVICGAVINVIMNFILIPKFGAMGASIASIFAEIIGLSIQIYNVRKIFDFKKIIKMSVKYLIASIMMYGMCLLLKQFIDNQLISLIVQMVCGLFTYIIILLFLKDQFMINFLKKFLKKGSVKK